MERPRLRQWALSLPGAVESGSCVFLTDPDWREPQRHAARQQISSASRVEGDKGWLCLPTGGTSGQLRFVRHDEETIGAAVEGFVRHFGVGRVNALGCLPAHHVSGLMARLRCAWTGGDYLHCEWKALAAGAFPDLGGDALESKRFISLVPTQLQRLLDVEGGAHFLRGFRTVLVGGAAVWPELADAAQRARIPVSLSYGMSETAAMVAAQVPEDFLAGARGVGKPMPHAEVELDANEGGLVRVSGGSVFRGYFPELRSDRTFVTEDLGAWDASGSLTILGRRDAVIITGGKKVWPTEVEDALRATRAFADVAVIGIPDETWGAAVTACYPADGLSASLDVVRGRLDTTLARYKQPKRYLPIAPWPRNAQGKVNRVELARLAEAVRR